MRSQYQKVIRRKYQLTAIASQIGKIGTNFTVGSNPNSVTVGDFNGDGKSDLAVANGGSNNVNDDSNIINGTPNRDTLTGTSQDDIITGFQGADILTGSEGNDQFVYQNIRDAGDIITDFNIAGQDKIVLTTLLNSLSYGGTNPITDNYVKFGTVGNNTIILIDKDGNGPLTPTTFITVQNVSLATLNTPNNFIF